MRRHLTRSLDRYRKLAAEQTTSRLSVRTNSCSATPFAGGARPLLRRARARRAAESGRGEAARQEPIPLEGEALIAAAADCDLIVSYRQSPGPAALFERLPKLIAFLRCAIDIRNVDVAGGEQGRRARHAGERRLRHFGEPRWCSAFWSTSRAASRARRIDYRAGSVPPARMGTRAEGQHARRHRLRRDRQGSRARRQGARHARAGQRSLRRRRSSSRRSTSCSRESDYVVPLAVATAETENLMDATRIREDEARRVSHQRLARQPGRRGRRSRRRSIRAISPAAPWTSAARPTRCRRRGSPRGRT